MAEDARYKCPMQGCERPEGHDGLCRGKPLTVRTPTVEEVEDEVGMGSGAWDMVPAAEIVAAVLRLDAEPPTPERTP